MMSGELSSTGASSACFGEIRNNSQNLENEDLQQVVAVKDK